MEAKVEQTPATNANPVLSVDKNGCVLYSNEADNTLLNEWGVRVGEKLPSYIEDIVQDITERKRAERKLRESEERFHSAFNDSAVAMAGLSGRSLHEC